MLLSVVVPVYNVEKYLEEAINSILRQSFVDFELILINDGSTDKSLEICKKYEIIDNRVTIIDKSNEGVSVARNEGLKKAKGDYIYFFDSDDILASNAFERIFSCIENKDIDFVMFNFESFRVINGSEHVRYRTNLKRGNYISISNGNDVCIKMIRNKDYRVAVWSYFYNAGFLKTNNIMFPEGIIHEDEEFVYKTFFHAHSIVVCDDCIYRHRLHNESIMGKHISNKNVNGYFTVLQDLLEYNDNFIKKNKAWEYIYRRTLGNYLHCYYENLKQNGEENLIQYHSIIDNLKKKKILTNHLTINAFAKFYIKKWLVRR